MTFKDLIKKLDLIMEELKDPSIHNDIASKTRLAVYQRVKSGKGVVSDTTENPPLNKLKALSAS